MSDIRIIFSPHTADPRFLREVAAAALDAQMAVAEVVVDAQIQILRAMLTAQFTFWDSVLRASLRPV
jgi:hypothetical protein